ncbi:hypothetical protein E2320_003767, partial [Naja naja]
WIKTVPFHWAASTRFPLAKSEVGPEKKNGPLVAQIFAKISGTEILPPTQPPTLGDVIGTKPKQNQTGSIHIGLGQKYTPAAHLG